MGNKILYIAFAGLLLSCSKETVVAPVGFSLEAGLPQTCTKTVLGAKSGGVYPVLWSSGDYISVGGVDSKPLSALEAGTGTATFKFQEEISAPYCALYGGVEGSDDQIEIPAVQVYSEGNIRGGYAPMYAVSRQPSFTMKHLSCVLALPLSGDVSVSGISLRSMDGASVAGRFALEKSGGVYTGSLEDISMGRSNVEMTIPEGGVDISSGKLFCIALRPATLTKGLSIDIYTTAGKRMNLLALEGETLEEGTVYEIPSVVFEANAEDVIMISSLSDLKDFAERVSSGEKYLQARLASDITVDGTWTPLEGFSGDFDGGGYTIYGLQKAFANELVGCIRNLTVEGEVSVSGADDIVGDESVNWAGILANRIYTGGTILNCKTKGSITYSQWGGKMVVVGALCGYAPRGKVSACVNEASVTAIGDGSAAVYAGGLFGRIYASSEAISVSDCRNDGSVTVRGEIKGASAGGVVGHMDANHTSTLSDDINTGTITIAASSTVSGVINIGGVAGYSKNDIDGCINTGVLHQAAATTYGQNVGGVAGQVVTSSVSACNNSGSIVLDAASANVVRCGGIIGYAYNDASVTSISVESCAFSGSILVDIPTHSTLFAKPITGLYDIGSHTENNCTSTGIVTIR